MTAIAFIICNLTVAGPIVWLITSTIREAITHRRNRAATGAELDPGDLALTQPASPTRTPLPTPTPIREKETVYGF